MILLQSSSKYLHQILSNRLENLEKGVELNLQWVEFDDVRYHIQASLEIPHLLLLSVSLPAPPPEVTFSDGLPHGAVEAIKAAYGAVAQLLDSPRDGFNLTIEIDLSKLPSDEENRNALLVQIASVREVVLCSPLRSILKNLATRTLAPDVDKLVPLAHRRNESFFLVPQADKVTVIFPMRFKDSVDTILATSFLQEIVEARRGVSLSTAPSCLWSPSLPTELNDVPAESVAVNSGFVTFVILPTHVEGKKLDKTVWSLSTFHAFVSYHVKSSEGFTYSRMRCRVESMIQALDGAKPDSQAEMESAQSSSFKRLVCNHNALTTS